MLTLKELLIGNFTKEYYLLALENYLYHLFYIYILSKHICRKMISEGCFSVSGDVLSVGYYAELLSTYFNLEIQSKHFENGRLLSIEGFDMEFVDVNHNPQSEFHSHLSDDSRKNTSITHAHVSSMLKELGKGDELNRNCIIWESIDSYCK